MSAIIGDPLTAAIDDATASGSVVAGPAVCAGGQQRLSAYDVVIGRRGRHVGLIFRQVIDQWGPRYNFATKRQDKTSMVRQIRHELLNMGCRFFICRSSSPTSGDGVSESSDSLLTEETKHYDQVTEAQTIDHKIQNCLRYWKKKKLLYQKTSDHLRPTPESMPVASPLAQLPQQQSLPFTTYGTWLTNPERPAIRAPLATTTPLHAGTSREESLEMGPRLSEPWGASGINPETKKHIGSRIVTPQGNHTYAGWSNTKGATAFVQHAATTRPLSPLMLSSAFRIISRGDESHPPAAALAAPVLPQDASHRQSCHMPVVSSLPAVEGRLPPTSFPFHDDDDDDVSSITLDFGLLVGAELRPTDEPQPVVAFEQVEESKVMPEITLSDELEESIWGRHPATGTAADQLMVNFDEALLLP